MLKIIIAALGLSQSVSLLASIGAVDSMTADQGCGPVRYDIVETVANSDASQNILGESLRVFFDEFHLTAQKPGVVTRTCQLDAKIRIPAGYRFLPRAAYAEGSYNIQPKEESQGFIHVTYEVQPFGRSSKVNNEKSPWRGEKDFTCRGELAEQQFLSCANHDTFVSLNSNLSLKIVQAGVGQSLIELDTQRKDLDLSWDWQFKPCVNYFEARTFRSYMKIGPSKALALQFKPYEDQGTLLGEAGEVGQLSQVMYSDDGKSVTGQWQLLDKTGSFKAHLLNSETGEFSGELLTKDGIPGKFYGYYQD